MSRPLELALFGRITAVRSHRTEKYGSLAGFVLHTKLRSNRAAVNVDILGIDA